MSSDFVLLDDPTPTSKTRRLGDQQRACPARTTRNTKYDAKRHLTKLHWMRAGNC